MTEELDTNLDDALELIERRKRLLKKIHGYSEAEAYLNSPPMEYKVYKRSNSSLMRFITTFWTIMVTLYVVLIWLGILTLDSTSIIVAFVLVIFGMMFYGGISSMCKKQYNVYMLGDEQKRELYERQMPRLKELRAQLESLDAFVDDSQNCIIPKEYWHQAQEIVAYIRNGRAESVEEAINLLQEDIKVLHAQDAK